MENNKLNNVVGNYDYFIFDLDGTLIDTKTAEKYAVAKIQKQLAVTESDFYKIYDVQNRSQWALYEKGEINSKQLLHKPWEVFLEQFKVKNYDIEIINKMFFTLLSEKEFVYPNTLKLMETLTEQNKKIYIATSGIEEWQDYRVQNSPFAKYVLRTIGADSGAMKPKKEFYHKLFSKIGNIDCKKILFIGDSLQSDIFGAKQFDIDTCWFNPLRLNNNTDIVPKYEIFDLIEIIKTGLNMEIEIRKTKVSDGEQDIKLADSVWRTAYAHIMPKEIFDDRESKFVKRLETFGSWGLNENGNVNYAAVQGDKIVGILHGSTLSNYLHYRELGYSDLTAIYIYPEYQHQGLGKRLLDTIINEFKKQGSKKMVIGVLKENHKARKAYEKWGGVLDTTYAATYNKFGYSFPEVFYIFDLASVNTDNL